MPASDTLLGMMTPLGLFRYARWRYRNSLLVFTYHSVVDVPEQALRRAPFLYRNSVTVEQFEAQLRYLHRQYRLLDADALTSILTGTDPWPERAAVLTFDDGLRNNATVAAPLLEATETPALFFLPTYFLDQAGSPRPHFAWSELLAAQFTFGGPADRRAIATLQSRVLPSPAPDDAEVHTLIHALKQRPVEEREALLQTLPSFTLDPTLLPADREGTSLLETMTWTEADALWPGIALGAHSVTHASLPSLPLGEAEMEIAESRRQIEEATGRPCRFFAYPYGAPEDVTSALYPLLERAGYTAAFTQWPGPNRPETERFALRRINIPGLPSRGQFRYHASGLHALRRSRR